MIRCAAEVIEVENRSLSAERGVLWVRVIDREAAELVVRAGRRAGRSWVRVVEVDEMVGIVIGIEGDSEKAALTAGIYRQLQCRGRCAVRADELYAASLFENKEPAIGRELHAGRCAQAGNERALGEAQRQYSGRQISRLQGPHLGSERGRRGRMAVGKIARQL